MKKNLFRIVLCFTDLQLSRGFSMLIFMTENAQMWLYSNLASNRCFAACQPDGQDKVGVLKCNWFCQTQALCWVLALGKQSEGGLRTCLEEEAETARTAANQPDIINADVFYVKSWTTDLYVSLLSSCCVRKVHGLQKSTSPHDMRRIGALVRIDITFERRRLKR
jgi:hypothetical protein